MRFLSFFLTSLVLTMTLLNSLLHIRKNHFQFSRIIIFHETPKMGTNKTTQRSEQTSTTLMTSLHILRI